MSKRYSTTYTFNTKPAAELFRSWLKINENDRDYGHPKFINLRQVGAADTGWCVEYQAENNFARGFATGCEWFAIHSTVDA